MLFGTLFVRSFFASAQLSQPDSAQQLQQVEVRAFEQNRKLTEIPAAVSLINKAQLSRFSPASILPALNSQPGIRMEERSPGSYRLNIRGSSLRSPFGVRNIKIYFNEIPYTTPGGDSYFNQLGFYNFQSVEIIKGPGSSLYGAGTGGVLLIRSDESNFKPGLQLDAMAGSFNSSNINLQARVGQPNQQHTIQYQTQHSDGYRDQTKMDRRVFSWSLRAKMGEKGTLSTHFLYSDLFYETPGGLNKTEFLSNPKAARPRVGATPGAAEAKAALSQKTFLAGISYSYTFNEQWRQTSTVYGAFTQLRNPGIFNYSRTTEPHTGGRTVWQFKQKAFTAHLGAEFQQGFTNAKAYKNVGGQPDSLRSDDDVSNRIGTLFAQGVLSLGKGWLLSGGASITQLKISVTRLSALPVTTKERRYSNEIAPRLALLKKIREEVSVYASVSKGFSPPTNSEVLPSSGIISTDLEAEKGISYEIGSRGNLHNGKFYYDINLFSYQLKNAIVVRRDNAGRDYFVNAGSTKQKGIETQAGYILPSSSHKIFGFSRVWASHTFYDFTYNEFIKGSTDFSGKKLPSVPKHTLVAGLDLSLRMGLYSNMTYSYNDPIPLNDANTDVSNAVHLISARVGWKKEWQQQIKLDLFVVGENLSDTHYSLGFDLNANGGRYYNTAAGRAFFGGISLAYLLGKK